MINIENGIQTYLLKILHRMGIRLTIEELEYFENQIVRNLWDKIVEKRMNEKKIIQSVVDATTLTLPNGRVGEYYKAEVNFLVEGVENYKIAGLDAVRLNFEKTEKGFCLSGIPMPENPKGGNFSLTLKYKPKALLENEEWLEKTFTLTLNPDPETLWEDKPTPRDIDYFKEDFDMQYIKVEAVDGSPRRHLVAASIRGRSHAHEGKPRDDHFKMHYSPDSEWYIIAVADGAGSAKYSRKGSEIACETVVTHCLKALSEDKEFEHYIENYANSQEGEIVPKDAALKAVSDKVYTIVGNAALKAYRAIQEEVNSKDDTQIKDYSTTLLLAICKRFDFGWAVASFWVGDGAMCVYNAQEHTADMLGMPDEGDYAGQTRFLTMSEIFASPAAFYKRLRFKIYKDFTALILMTDGVSDPKFTTDSNLKNPEKWNALWEDLSDNGVELSDDNEKAQEQLLEWLKFKKRGEHDDRTIAILY